MRLVLYYESEVQLTQEKPLCLYLADCQVTWANTTLYSIVCRVVSCLLVSLRAYVSTANTPGGKQKANH